MRMWMVDPKIMCKEHLLGEHLETHMFLGTLKRSIHLDGYVDSNCLELKSLKKRHDDLADEMFRRGYNHKSPLNIPNGYCFGQSKYVVDSKINKGESLKELLSRCKRCKSRMEELNE
jgi:hypothetical protein